MEEDADLLHVLVIDDDQEMRDYLTQILLPRGCQVVSEGSAEKGLELLPYFSFQVAFLDHNLPGMEGLLLGEYLTKSNPDMEVALVTGSPDEQLPRTAQARDIRVITKPFKVAEILDVIDEFKQKAEARAEQRRSRQDEAHTPPISLFQGELAECFAIPRVPQRIEDKLVQTIKRCLNDLKSVGRYNERDRVLALSGLLSLKVLGIEPSKASSGRTLYAEYDDIMRAHGRRAEFSEDS